MSGFVLGIFLRRSSRDFADYIHEQFPEFHGSSKLHLSIVHRYFYHLFDTCDPTTVFKSTARGVDSFMQVLKNVIFMVPRVTKFNESQYGIKKYQLVEILISFLLQLLYHKTDFIIDSCKDGLDDLEKELRFLLTILGDTSLMMCADEHEELKNLLAEFEAVANEAGSLVYLVFFSTDRAFGEIDEGLSFVLDHVNLLKTSIMEFLNLVSAGRISFMTPRTSVMNSLLFVDSLIYCLEDLVNWDHSNLIAGVKNEIDTLHWGLISFRSLFKEPGLPQLTGIGELQEPLMQIGDFVSGGEYLIIAFLVGDAPLWYLIDRLSDINHRIELTRIKLLEITRRYKLGGFETVSNFSGQLMLRDHKRNSDAAIGLKEQATDILELLLGGTKHLQVISIHGMPGVGKTTLANKVYNHPSVNHRFDKHSWCVISQAYKRESVLTDIFIQLTGENNKLKIAEERLVECIYKTLKGRRYFIVMDDIWDSCVWDDFRRCFPDDGNSSRILFTTRNKDVAPFNSKICALDPLCNDQCWELLMQKVFNKNPCPPELLGIAKEISSNCHGIPLVVVAIAGVLSQMDQNKSSWEKVGENLASYIFEGGENSVMNILELSYKHLSDHLKPCFLYFGAFQRETEISASKLMRLWIAEGFICEEEGKSAENVAEEYLIKLIDRSLVMVSKTRSDGGVKACVIHDLLRDLCLKKCEDESFLSFVKENDCSSIYAKSHRLQDLDRYVVPPIYCQHLRSFRGHYLSSKSESFYVRDLRLLRVLHFDFINRHYIGIEYLFSLRYLVVSVLPPSIGSLVNLEYLRVETQEREERVYLPSAIMKTKLRYIHVHNYNQYTDTYIAYGEDWDVSQTSNLEFLSTVVISQLEDEEILKCSPHLRKLKCVYEEAVVSMIKATRHVDISIFTQLVSLNVCFRGYTMLEKISFSSSIKKLTLSGKFIRPWKEISVVVGRLENLEVLKLRQIWSFMGLGDRWDTRDGEFEKLRYLEINGADLHQWNVESSQHFPRLEQLLLRSCYKMEEIPSEIGEITTLLLIEVRGPWQESMVESARRIQQEQRDMGNDELRIDVSEY